MGAAIGAGLAAVLGRGAGVGGVDRGGSSTGLLWGETSDVDREAFAPRLLSPSRFLDLERSGAIGVSVEAPEVEAAAESAGLVDVEGAAGEASWRRRLSPRHRDAVRTFFSQHERDSR